MSLSGCSDHGAVVETPLQRLVTLSNIGQTVQGNTAKLLIQLAKPHALRRMAPCAAAVDTINATAKSIIEASV
jgi:hypothetical protein